MKIYLAKSNASCFEVYSLVKKKLQSTGHEIIEFSGGKYDADSILQADMLFIVPPHKTMGDLTIVEESDGICTKRRFDFVEDCEYSDYTVGMGQSQQILHWMNSKHKMLVIKSGESYGFDGVTDVLVLKTVQAEGTENIVLNVDYIDNMDITKDEIKEDYSILYTSGDEYNTEELIPTIEGAIPGVVSSEIMLGATMFYPV